MVFLLKEKKKKKKEKKVKSPRTIPTRTPSQPSLIPIDAAETEEVQRSSSAWKKSKDDRVAHEEMVVGQPRLSERRNVPPHPAEKTGKMETLFEFQLFVEDMTLLREDEAARENQSNVSKSTESVESKTYLHVQIPEATTLNGMWQKKNQASTPPQISIVVNAGNTVMTGGGKRNFMVEDFYLVLFLLLLGLIAGPLHFGVERLFSLLLKYRGDLTHSYQGAEGVQYLIWTSHTVVLLLCAWAWTKISPIAKGSGIPQMKAILTGVDPDLYLPGYFSMRTFVAKLGGVVLANGSGLIVGTEGAFVHLMSIITTIVIYGSIKRLAINRYAVTILSIYYYL